MGALGRPGRGSRIGLAAVFALSLVLASPAVGQEHHPPGILPPGDWTHEQITYAEDLVERTEAALPAFGDIPTIQALGFENLGVTAPGGYDHWINWGWIDDGHLIDPEFPESLVFRNTFDGGYVLEAAMFLADSHHDMSNLPEEMAWLPGWHNHADVCIDDDGHFTGLAGSNGECFSGHPFDKPPMMHVWIVDNECGHRFGEIGVSGLICDVDHAHQPGPGHDPDLAHDPDLGHDPAPGHDPGRDSAPPAPPAPRVAGEPNFTG